MVFVQGSAWFLFPGISAEVKGIINYYGSCSVMKEDSNPTQLLHCQPDSPEGMVMGHVDLRNNLELKKKLSVECNITEETQMPPTLIFHGTKDCVVNCEGSAILYRQMKKCGKDVRFYLIKGGNHGGAEFWTEQVLDIVDEFLKKCFAKEKTREREKKLCQTRQKISMFEKLIYGAGDIGLNAM